MNHMEIRGLAVDFHKDSGEIDEPGADATRRPHVPAGIEQPLKKRSSYGKPLPQKAHGELDETFGKRVVNALLREEEIETAGEVEDALIDAIDKRSRRKPPVTAFRTGPRSHGHAKLVRIA